MFAAPASQTWLTVTQPFMPLSKRTSTVARSSLVIATASRWLVPPPENASVACSGLSLVETTVVRSARTAVMR